MSERKGKRGAVVVLALVAVLCAGCSGEERHNDAPAASASPERFSLEEALDFSAREDYRLNQVWAHSGEPYEPDERVLDACKGATSLPATWTQSCSRTLRQALTDGRVMIVYSAKDDAALELTAGPGARTLSVDVCRTSTCQKVVCGDGKDGEMAGPVPVALRALPCREAGKPRKVIWSW